MASIGGSNNDTGFQSRGESGIICPSSGMTTNPYFASAWDPVVSLSLQESFGGSSLVSQTDFGNSPYPDAVQNHGISCSSRLVHYPSDSSFVQLPKLPCFGSGGFAELVAPFGQNESGHTLNEAGGNRSIQNVAQSHEDHQVSEDTVTGASPTGRRRKRGLESDSHFRSTVNSVNAVGGLQKDTSKESSDTPDKQDEKKLKTEQNAGANLRGKQVAKQAKDSSQGGEPPKDNYIHVRARRGQATNSHSLAERVRREKISERMKTLQELVPGCNKITGKAVMLDEIINYVQSLQQQVEFLSMKLATVYPELNIDIERILSKDIIYSRCGNAAALGFNPEMNSHSPSNGMYSAGMPLVPNTNLLFPPMTQPILDNEVQSFLQMGLDSNSGMNSLACNGNWTLETRALKSRRGLLTTNSSNRS